MTHYFRTILMRPGIIAFWMLVWMASWMTYEAWLESATMDEAAHIPAGYSYIIKKDMRLNPEHPPLVKDLAGLSIAAFVRNVNFPEKLNSWKENVNDQWSFGFDFLYRSQNDADALVFAARIPAIALTIILGMVIYFWARELFGAGWALLPLALFSFSPNFVAHGKLVTTDIAATLGVILALYTFNRYLASPTRKNFFIADLSLGIGLLLKFTVTLIVPILGILAFLKMLKEKNLVWIMRYLGIGVMALLIVWFVYAWHVWNYPQERQLRDARHILTSYGIAPLKNFDFWLINQPILRPLGQYLLGLLMNMQRAAGGNTTYFMGEVSAAGWRTYFPIVYNLKEPLPILILIYLGLLIGIKGWWEKRQINLPMFGMVLFVILYWSFSIVSHLNIGVRHIFPTLPLIYLLITAPIKQTFSSLTPGNSTEKSSAFNINLSMELKRIAAWAGFLTLMLWLFIEFLLWAPWHLAYFNEIAGGPPNAYRYVVDSNLDWGQSLKELRDFVIKQNIPKIKVDYFGGGDAKYYLGERFEPLTASMGPQKGWLAISATFLQGERGRPAPGFDQPYGRYRWLDPYEPIAKIGYSIFVYRIE
jgi:hypothetical protein